MSGSSYVQRKLDFTFVLKKGEFTGSGGNNTLSVSGLRASTTMSLQGVPSYYQLTAKIYGLPQSVMNDLATMGMPVMRADGNRVDVYAGDTEAGTSLTFSGNINDAFANYSSAPQVSFDITATTGLYDAISAVSPISYQGSVDVASILSTIAGQMNPPRVFENNGVSAIVYNAYHAGTLVQQIQEICDAANIRWCDENGILAIWPIDGHRGGAVPLISPKTGMVGYPKYTQYGLDVVTIYNPSIRYGGWVQVESSIKGANKMFNVHGLTHNLEAQMPNGAWFTTLNLYDEAIYKQRGPTSAPGGPTS